MQVYLFEKSGEKWALSATLTPTSALSEAVDQPGKLSAAFKDKLAMFKGHTSQVCSSPCAVGSPHMYTCAAPVKCYA